MEKRILDIQPSQCYLSREKVMKAKKWMSTMTKEAFLPLPIKQISHQPFFTDGHTRAFLAVQMGWETIPVVWDEDDLPWDAYLTCVQKAKEQGIFTVADLSDRILSETDYQEKWIDWCAPLFKEQ